MDRKDTGQLTQLLKIRITEEGLSNSALAETIGISRSYLSEILAEKRAFSGMKLTVIRRIAVFLKLSSIEVLFLAGTIQKEDFFRPGGRQATVQDLEFWTNANAVIRQHRL